MTLEEYKNLQPGDQCVIARKPTNGDHQPGIGHEFIVREKSAPDYIYPTVTAFGGCWHMSYCDLVKKKDIVTNQYQIY